MNKIITTGLVASLAFLTSLPTWAVYDVTKVTAGIGDAVTAVLAIGAAVVLVVLGVKVFKWIARSL